MEKRTGAHTQKYLCFVYGTLKTEEPNHHWLTNADNGTMIFKGIAKTKERYPLVVASRYNIPYVLASPGQGNYVEGEVYEVDRKMLAHLDILEVHPEYYERKEIPVVFLESGEETTAWIYLLHSYKSFMPDLPNLVSYSSKNDGTEDYIPSYLREVQGPEYWTDVKDVGFPTKND
ncbi:putative gamma-glutamylcyclotransferase CG2811 isoform X2 [Oratosquilla oratoria]|uniref:putative gamma-glutamylcyclotransferase CG2811 isoform X2 n=1 Tax=Oratosquilla oratoria TaxID=337810 RepID=UPI003F75B5E3